jgi:hypothetical protein
MSFPSATRALVIAVLLGTTPAGCSDIYYDRRDTISLASGEAMAANRVTHVIDPWPPASANRNIAYSGEKMQVAAERYRTGRIIPPINAMTSSAQYGQQQAPPALQLAPPSGGGGAPK